MSKHTPGPWKISKPVIADGTPDYAIVVPEKQIIAEVFGRTGQHSYHPSEDNANLIAAAPDLLEALEKAYSQCIEFLNEGDFKRHIEWDAGYIVDAIAKAKGEK